MPASISISGNIVVQHVILTEYPFHEMGILCLQKDRWEPRNNFKTKVILSQFQNMDMRIQMLSSGSASSSFYQSKANRRELPFERVYLVHAKC